MEEEYKPRIHDHFGLTYANYMVLPRSILQSMPYSWQERFVELIDELDEHFDWRREGIVVRFEDVNGKPIPNGKDRFNDYRRGNRIISQEECKDISEKHNELYRKGFPAEVMTPEAEQAYNDGLAQGRFEVIDLMMSNIAHSVQAVRNDVKKEKPTHRQQGKILAYKQVEFDLKDLADEYDPDR